MGSISGRTGGAAKGRRATRRDCPAPRLRAILVHRLALLGVTCATFAAGFWLMPLQASDEPQVQDDSSELVGELGDVESLITRFDCWSGAAPADMEGQVPGHVIVTRAGDDHPIRGGDLLVGQALEQTFDGVDHDLRVHAFCR